MTYHSGTVGTTCAKYAAHQRPLHRLKTFPTEVLALLAVAEYVHLKTAEERAAWATAHGLTRPVPPALLNQAKQAFKRREANKRLGLPDPLRHAKGPATW